MGIETQAAKRFRTNPIEIAIFLAVTGIFAHSLYRLFYENPDFHPTALSPAAAHPEDTDPKSQNREVSSPLGNLEVQCGSQKSYDFSAAKVRLSGVLCGMEAQGDPSRGIASMDSSRLIKTVILNTANRFNATVFTDLPSSKFSTDYIPLNSGKNPILIEFTYMGGKVVTQELVITRN